MQQWLNQHWVAAALCMAILLTVLMPVLAQQRPFALLLIFAMLPAYMFHQVEEHRGDRFRLFGIGIHAAIVVYTRGKAATIARRIVEA